MRIAVGSDDRTYLTAAVLEKRGLELDVFGALKEGPDRAWPGGFRVPGYSNTEIDASERENIEKVNSFRPLKGIMSGIGPLLPAQDHKVHRSSKVI